MNKATVGRAWLIGAMAAVFSLWCPSATGAPEEPAWGPEAVSAILTTESLAAMAPVLPAWRSAQMVWPSQEEVRAARARAADAEVSRCMDWVSKFVRPEFLPGDFKQHLVAMKRWGRVGPPAREKRPCDVFIVRWRQESHVVQIQESPHNVTVVIADERLASVPRRDHKEFVWEMSRIVLRDELQWDEAVDPVWTREETGKSADIGATIRITHMQWRVPSVVVTSPKDGKPGTMSGVVAEQVGADMVAAYTDGRFVRLDIVKHPKGPRASPDPYLERFSQAGGRTLNSSEEVVFAGPEIVEAAPTMPRSALVFPSDEMVARYGKTRVDAERVKKLSWWFPGVLQPGNEEEVLKDLCVTWDRQANGFDYPQYCRFRLSKVGRYLVQVKERNIGLLVCVRDTSAHRPANASLTDLKAFAVATAEAVFKEDFWLGKPGLEVEVRPIPEKEAKEGIGGAYGRASVLFHPRDGKVSDPQLLGPITFWTDGEVVVYSMGKDVAMPGPSGGPGGEAPASAAAPAAEGKEPERDPFQ